MFSIGAAKYDLELNHLVDDGPFYQRYMLSAERIRSEPTARSAERVLGNGMAEYVEPDRIDVPWQRPFVAMKTQLVDSSRKNSILLPLFTGFKADRAARLARSLAQSAGIK